MNLERRVRALESRSRGPLIDSWTAYAKWNHAGRDPNAVWDAEFKKELEELARSSGCSL